MLATWLRPLGRRPTPETCFCGRALRRKSCHSAAANSVQKRLPAGLNWRWGASEWSVRASACMHGLGQDEPTRAKAAGSWEPGDVVPRAAGTSVRSDAQNASGSPSERGSARDHGPQLTGSDQLPVRAPFPSGPQQRPSSPLTTHALLTSHLSHLAHLSLFHTPPLASHPGCFQPSNGAAWDRGRIPLLQQTHPSRRARRSLIKIFLFFRAMDVFFALSNDSTRLAARASWSKGRAPGRLAPNKVPNKPSTMP